jgi:cytochrome bd ubiquinol oxidase subunit I
MLWDALPSALDLARFQFAFTVVFHLADSSFVANTSVALKGLRWCDDSSETWADGG